MKKLLLLPALVIFLLLNGCKKDSGTTTNTTTVVGKTFKWKIDGVQYEAPNSLYAAIAPSSGSNTLAITGSGTGGVYGAIMIQDFNSVGNYTIGGVGASASPANMVTLQTSGTQIYQNNAGTASASISINVTNKTTTNIKGTFSGTIKNGSFPSTFGTVTEGVFDINF